MVPNNVAELRKKRGLTQGQLAHAIDTTRDTLAKLESGARPLHVGWLEKIGEALEVPPYLLIAPQRFVPTEDELASMIEEARSEIEADVTYGDWPHAVAANLLEQLQQRLGVPSSDSEIASAREILPDEAAQSHAPTKRSALAK